MFIVCKFCHHSSKGDDFCTQEFGSLILEAFQIRELFIRVDPTEKRNNVNISMSWVISLEGASLPIKGNGHTFKGSNCQIVLPPF